MEKKFEEMSFSEKIEEMIEHSYFSEASKKTLCDVIYRVVFGKLDAETRYCVSHLDTADLLKYAKEEIGKCDQSKPLEERQKDILSCMVILFSLAAKNESILQTQKEE